MRAPLLQLYADWWPASPGAAREEGGVSGLLVYTQKEFFNIRAGSESCRAAAKVLPSEKIEGGGPRKMQKIKCGFKCLLGPLSKRAPKRT